MWGVLTNLVFEVTYEPVACKCLRMMSQAFGLPISAESVTLSCSA
jgi:hypothetical protein